MESHFSELNYSKIEYDFQNENYTRRNFRSSLTLFVKTFPLSKRSKCVKKLKIWSHLESVWWLGNSAENHHCALVRHSLTCVTNKKVWHSFITVTFPLGVTFPYNRYIPLFLWHSLTSVTFLYYCDIPLQVWHSLTSNTFTSLFEVTRLQACTAHFCSSAHICPIWLLPLDFTFTFTDGRLLVYEHLLQQQWW